MNLFFWARCRFRLGDAEERKPPRASLQHMLFYSFFKTLVGKEIVVELKNDMNIRGTLHSVDQYLNVKLLDISVHDEGKFPQLVSNPTPAPLCDGLWTND